MRVQDYLEDKSQSWRLFDRQVSASYDQVADLISFRLYRRWCRALAEALPNKELKILDLATGTGAIPAAITDQRPAHHDQITGLDLSEEMMAIFREKLSQNPTLDARVTLTHGDATDTGLPEQSFDAVTMACGIRNVGDAMQGMREIHRLLKPGGQVYFLEPALPQSSILRGIFLFYFRKIVPLLAGLLSRGDAYRYFNQSVEAFAYGDDFLDMMREAGFQRCSWSRITLGAGALYVGTRAEN